MIIVNCQHCSGSGRIYCVGYHYGVTECSYCDGSGYLTPNGDPLTEKDWDDFYSANEVKADCGCLDCRCEKVENDS